MPHDMASNLAALAVMVADPGVWLLPCALDEGSTGFLEGFMSKAASNAVPQ